MWTKTDDGKVAFFVLTGLHLAGAPAEEMETVYSFCEETSLPATFSGIGITDTGRSRLIEIAIKVCAQTEAIHHEAVRITPEKVFNDMVTADAMGRARRNKLQ